MSNQYAPGTAEIGPGPAMPPQQPPKAKRPFYKKKRYIIPAGLVTLGIIGSVTSGGGNSSDPNASGGTPQASSTASASAPAAKSSKPAATKAAAAPKSKPAKPAVQYPGQKDGDQVVRVGQEVKLSGWTTTASKLNRTSIPYIGKYYCTKVALHNRDTKQQDYSPLSWKLQTPSGQVQDATFTGQDDELGSESLAPGGDVAASVCFDVKSTKPGKYVVFWQPDVFSSEDRGAWVNQL